jgi:hypothetical protein
MRKREGKKERQQENYMVDAFQAGELTRARWNRLCSFPQFI